LSALPTSRGSGVCPRRLTCFRVSIDNLAAHPLVGRRIEGELRELIISYGHSGYVALYRFVVSRDENGRNPTYAPDSPTTCSSKIGFVVIMPDPSIKLTSARHASRQHR
jgi:hypothetical protein